MRGVSCGARLHGVPFGGERRVPIQSARPRLQCGPDAREEPVIVRGVSWQCDPEGEVTDGALGDRGRGGHPPRPRRLCGSIGVSVLGRHDISARLTSGIAASAFASPLCRTPGVAPLVPGPRAASRHRCRSPGRRAIVAARCSE